MVPIIVVAPSLSVETESRVEGLARLVRRRGGVFLGLVGAFVVWLMYKDQSPRISFHALQSLWYQVAWLVILAVGWTVTGLLTMIIIGFFLIPVMIVLTLVPFVHMAYAAYKISQGVDYRYPWVADMVSEDRRL